MISMQGLVLILVVVLIVFGPGKLPEVAKSIGRGIREFRNASNDITPGQEQPNKVEPPKLEPPKE